MKLNQKDLLKLLEEGSEFKVSTNLHKTSINRSIISSLILDKLNILNQESQSPFKSHLIMDLEMKSIPLVMYSNFCLINQREISSNMLIMIKRFSVSLLDSTLESLKMLIEGSLFPSICLTTLFQSSSQLKRTLALLKANSWKEENTRM